MGDPACYREYVPNCDLEVTITDEQCPECGINKSAGTSPFGRPQSGRDANRFGATLSAVGENS